MINIDKTRGIWRYPSSRLLAGYMDFIFHEMNLFWGAKFDHGMLLCDVPREWVQVCGWDNAQRKQMPDHKEVEQSGSGRN